MNYWILIANPEYKEHWNWTTTNDVGEKEGWLARDKNSNPKRNFRNVKIGDLIIGYNSGNQHQFVALATITKELYEDENSKSVIEVMKTKDIDKPINFSDVNNRVKKRGILQGTIVRITKDEYEEILDTIVK